MQPSGQILPSPQSRFIYAYGQKTNVPTKDSFYQEVGKYIAGGHSPEEIAREFSNNPYGVSYRELYDTAAAQTGYNLIGGTPQAAATTGGGYVEPQFNLRDKINALNELYNVIYQDLASMTQEQRKKIEEGYGRQAETAQTGYEQTARILPQQYGSQGIRYSSYYENAAKQASDAYNQAIQDIQAAKESKLGELGRTYETQRASLQAGQSALGGLPQYGSQADVAALEQQLGSLAQQRAGMGTQGSYLSALQNIAPAPTTSATQLEAKLKELTGQSIPSFAKQTIGAGQIKQSGLAPEQQQYYTDYFQKLLQGSQSQGA